MAEQVNFYDEPYDGDVPIKISSNDIIRKAIFKTTKYEIDDCRKVPILDIRCIHTINSTTVATGIGNQLHLFHEDKSRNKIIRIICEYQLPEDKVNGIVSHTVSDLEHDVLFYGGRSLVFVRLKRVENSFTFSNFHLSRFECWLYQLKILSDAPGLFCILTPKNVVGYYKYDLETGISKYSNSRRCTFTATLYSSFISGNKSSELLIFGGTAFGDLVIWSPLLEENEPIKIFSRIHNGVIFSIDYSPNIELLATSSDDRSVNIWTVEKFDESVDIKKLTTFYGHLARVFKCLIVAKGKNNYAITIGEDSFFCVWSIDTKELIFNKKQHSGKIWSIAYDSHLNLLYTGGSEGSLSKYNLTLVLNRTHIETRIISINGSQSKNSYISKIRYMGTNTPGILCITNDNELFFYTNSNLWIRLENVIDEPVIIFKVNSYDNNEENSKLRLVGISGMHSLGLFYFNFDEAKIDSIQSIRTTSDRIRSFIFLKYNNHLISYDLGKCTYVNLYISCELDFILPGSKDRVVTHAMEHRGFLLIGDRCGSLHLFVISESNILHRQTLNKLHGHLGITCMELEQEFSDDTTYELNIILLTGGHDGMLKRIKISWEIGKIWTSKMFHIQSLRTPIPQISRILMKKDSSKVQKIIGFHNNMFSCWSQTDGVIMEVPSNGTKRYWDFYLDHNTENYRFINILKQQVTESIVANSNLMECSLNSFNHNWHSKVCNRLVLWPLRNICLAISGGEDNILKVTKVDRIPGYGNHYKRLLTPIGEFHSHVSSIRGIITCLFRSKDGLRESFAFEPIIGLISFGGRAQICINLLQIIPRQTNGAVNPDDIEESIPRINLQEKVNYMLKMSDLQRKKAVVSDKIDFDPETRFMGAVLLDNTMELVLACSDGYLRRFELKLNAYQLPGNCLDNIGMTIEFKDSYYYERCITCIDKISIGKCDVIITTATDGKVCFWDPNEFSGDMKPILEVEHHQGGIICCDVEQKDRKLNRFMLATGGDDQQVVYAEVTINVNGNGKIDIEHKLIQRQFYHEAQVTAVKFNTGCDCLYSCGLDQELIQYSFKTEIVNRRHTCIFDVKGIQIIQFDEYDNIIVYGCGIQSLNMDRPAQFGVVRSSISSNDDNDSDESEHNSDCEQEILNNETEAEEAAAKTEES